MNGQAPEIMTISRRRVPRRFEFRSQAGLVATATSTRRRTARIEISDGRTWLVTSDDRDGISLLEDDRVIAIAPCIDRLGRRWELSSDRFAFELASRSRLKGRWILELGGTEIAEFRLLTTKKIHVHSNLTVPLVALVLAWYLIVRMGTGLVMVGTAT